MFDFEEADDQNFETMPMNWYIVGRDDESSDQNFLRIPLHQRQMKRKGFPRFCKVQFDRPQIEQGNHQFQLHIDGGSAAAFLEVGTIAAVPDSDYVVSAKIKTTALKHARARLLAYFVDARGKRIDETTVSTSLLETAGEQRDVSLKLTGHPKAAWIGMQVELLQPQLLPSFVGDSHRVNYQEVRGTAWFDDIGIWQVPRITVQTQSKVNIIVAPERPYLSMGVRDLAAQHLKAHVAIYDHDLKLIDEVRRDVGGDYSSIWHWQPKADRFGWYLVDMVLYDTTPLASIENLPGQAKLVGRTISSFLWLPPRNPLGSQGGQRFTIDVHDASPTEMAFLPQLLKRTGVSSVAVSAFSADTTLGTLPHRHERLDKLLAALRRQRGEVVLNFSPLPRVLVDQRAVGRDDPLWLLAQPAAQWQAFIAPLTLKHGQQIKRWQVGRPRDADIADAANAMQTIRTASNALHELAPRPTVVVPWRLHQNPPTSSAKVGVEFTIDVPPSVQPRYLPAYLKPWKERAGNDPFVVQLRVPDATQVSHGGRMSDFALRMLYCWSGGADGVVLDRPWVLSGDAEKNAYPDPLLGVFSTVSRELYGRKALGWLPIRRGVKALILDGERGGALALWNESASVKNPKVNIYLGEDPKAIDVFGNPVRIEASKAGHLISLRQSPIIVTGIDAKLAVFRSQFAFKPFLLKSLLTNHEHKLSVFNPWSQRIQGTLLITTPDKSWQVAPRQLHFSIDPGETTELPIELQFPPSETAGAKELTARFDFIADDHHYRLDVSTEFEMGLPGIRMESSLSTRMNQQTGKEDAIVTLFITNTGDKIQSLYEFAVMEGYARQERIIAALSPGQFMIRHFHFPGAGANLKNTPVRVGLRESAGPALMNHVLSLDD